MRRLSLVALLLAVTALSAAAAPYYTWQHPWEPILKLPVGDHLLLGTAWGGGYDLLDADGERLLRLPGSTLLLETLEGELVTAFHRRAQATEKGAGQSGVDLVEVLVGTPEDYVAGTPRLLASLAVDSFPRALALSPSGERLALGWTLDDPPGVRWSVHELPDGSEAARLDLETEGIAWPLHPAFSDDGSRLYFTTMSPREAELGPLTAWRWETDEAPEPLTGPLGSLLPVEGWDGGRLLLLEELTPGRRWVTFDPGEGLLRHPFLLSLNADLYDSTDAYTLFDGDPTTFWTPPRGTVVDIALGRTLPLASVALFSGAEPVTGWGVIVDGQTRRRDDPADSVDIRFSDTVINELRLILSPGVPVSEVRLDFAFAPGHAPLAP